MSLCRPGITCITLTFIGINMKTLLVWNPRLIVVIFGMSHHLVNLQVCSNYILWAKKSPATGVSFNIDLYREKHEKNLLKPQGLEHHLVNLYQVCSNYAPRAKKTNKKKLAPPQVSPVTWSALSRYLY